MKSQNLFNTELMYEMLQESDYDVLVAASPHNIHFVSGSSVARTVRDPSGEYRMFFSVIPKDGDPSLIVVGWEEIRAKATSSIKDVRPYFEFKEPPLELLADILKEKGYSKGNIGIEKSYIISTYWEKLMKLMPDAKFEECTDLFARARSIKTPEAIKLFRKASYKTEKAIALGFASAKYGDTELSLAREMQSNIVKLGADMYNFAALASGPESYMVHLRARNQKMVKGDVVHIDFGGVFSGYRTDISRGGVCVKANEKQTQRWKSLWRAERSAIEKSVQVGKKASDIYNTLKKEFKANNIRFESYHGPGHIGHSIGLETHEPPMLQPYNDTLLEENMILCIEPTVLEKGWARYHIEDMVLITKKGPEILSNYTEGDELFVIEE